MSPFFRFPFTLLDITQPLHECIPSWEGEGGFQRKREMDYDQLFRTESFLMRAGIGTHIDAPSHHVPQGMDIAGIPIEHLLAPLICIHCNSALDPNFMLSRKEIEQFESFNGIIEEGSFVLISTGWHQFWSDPKRYRNENGKKMHFPGVEIEAAQLFLQRKIVGLGIDTLSPDGGDYGFPVHMLLLSSGIFLVENIADCHKVPTKGAFILLMPLKIESATEAPMRAVVLVP